MCRLVFAVPVSVCSLSFASSTVFFTELSTSFFVSLSANAGAARASAIAPMMPLSMGCLLRGKLTIGCPVGNRSSHTKKSEGASCGGNPRLDSTAPAYRGVLGVVVEVLLLELLFDGLVGLLGFIPLLPEPGVLDVSV